ncbi:MAG: hypothetical protein K0S30_1847 [Clostridia bacterium]|jgi:hypothetical protein|nr:hypothetical protein [Clostridia bacterium]
MFKNQNNRKGMSYIEVAICLFAVSIVILPLSQAFVASVKLKEETKSISQSTFYAETLLEEVKEQLEKDLSGVRKMEIEFADKTQINSLTDFFELGTTEEELANFREMHDAERYAYEVAVWNIKHLALTDGNISLSSSFLADAIKFYSDETHQFSDSDIERIPKLKVDKLYQGLFKDETFFGNFIPTPIDNITQSSVIGVSTLKLKMRSDGTLSYVESAVQQTGKIELAKPGIIGTSGLAQQIYTYKIKKSDSSAAGVGVVIIDTKELDADVLKKTILKFDNEAQMPINLKLLMNKADQDSINEKLHVIIADAEADKKTTLERITELDRQENYIIAVIVREKNPRMGHTGKIVKTMMDVYSFENSQ